MIEFVLHFIFISIKLFEKRFWCLQLFTRNRTKIILKIYDKMIEVFIVH